VLSKDREPRPSAAAGTYCLPLTCGDAPLTEVGGKGRNLVELTASGFAVPPGFIVATAAYHRFVTANELGERIQALAGTASPADPEALERVSAEIRALFAAGELPEEIGRAVTTAYDELSAGGPGAPVAVRSSATAEDLPDLSFAGQQDTYLNVVGAEAVRRAVQRCWGSLWTARALGYRAQNGIAPDGVGMAVVVQRLVASETSGVVFTANPLTGHRGEIVIDASFGLGEAVVSGQVEPDHFVVDAGRWEVTSRVLGAKALAIVPRPGGETETVRRDDGDRQCLSDEQVLELARTAARVAEHFGAPQDVEWAWADRLHLLQARPITSLYPLPAPTDGDGDRLRLYLNFSAIQGMMGPLTPMGRAAIRLLGRGFQPNSPRELVAEAGGRIFCDITGAARDPRLRRVLLGAVGRVDPGARQALVQLIREGRLAAGDGRPSGGGRRRGPLRRLRAPAAMVKRLFPARRLIRRVLAALLRPARARVRAVAAAEAFLTGVRRRASEATDLAGVLAAFKADLQATPAGLYAHLVPLIGPTMLLMSMVDGWLVRWLRLEPGSGLQLMRGLPDNVTVEMDLVLWGLAKTIRTDPAIRRRLLESSPEALTSEYRHETLPPAVQAGLGDFLRDYGMRGVAEIDLGRPRWRDDPTLVLDLLLGYLELEDAEASPESALARGAEEAERLRAEYVGRLRSMPRGRPRAKLLGAAIHRMRVLGGLRELPKLQFCKILDVYRTRLREHGRQLAAAGSLAAGDDIFFVPFEALERFAAGEGVDLQALVAAERAAYAREVARRRPPRLLLSTGETFYEGLTEAGSSDLVGAPVSPGMVEGRVRVVLAPQGVRLEPGEILVCPSTDPCWTPLFVTAGGLVMEMGGLTTHGAVVAREYGIPAVVGVHHATEQLTTGERVRVDGSAGRVTRIE
jgi:pyruvate,water dikinase